MDYATESLRLHGAWKGKIEVVSRVPVNNKDQLSLAYTPGVAQPCLEIQKDMDKSYELTRRHNLVAVITDGTAIVVGAADRRDQNGRQRRRVRRHSHRQAPHEPGGEAPEDGGSLRHPVRRRRHEPRPGPDGRHHQPGAVQRHLGRRP